MWYIARGGRDAVHNKHVPAPDQRFAYDFVVVRGGDVVHKGGGARNEDHRCRGKPVVARVARRVVTAVDSVADNVRPDEMNSEVPPGNRVVIDHGNGEHSLLAHFRRSSVAVRDEVEAGALLGECPNSRNTSLSHGHYHLQTGPAYQEGVGLPAFFNGYFVGGSTWMGEPMRGEVVVPYGSQ